MEINKINQKEYLKRYLSKDDGKKKKKKKLKIGPKTVQIIDDDVDIKKLIPIDNDEISILNTTEDAPQIVGIIDECGPVDFANKQRWKVIADDGTGDVQISKVEHCKIDEQDNTNDLSNKKQFLSKDCKIKKKQLKHKSIVKKKRKNDSDSNSSSESKSKYIKKGKKKKKHVSKQRKNSSSDSISDSDSDSESSYTDSDLSPKISKINDKISNKMRILSKNKRKLKRRKYNDDLDLNQSRLNKNDKLLNRTRESSNSDPSPTRNSKHSKQLISNNRNKILDRRKMDKLKQSDNFNKYNEFNVNCKLNSDNGSAKYLKSINDRLDKYDSDLSPPRKSRTKNNGSDKYDSDLSPPRKSRIKNNGSDKYDSDLSPPRKSRTKNNGSDKYDSDLSPPRKSRTKNDRSDKYDSDLSTSRNSNFRQNSPLRYSKQEGTKALPYSSQRSKISRWDEERKLPNKENNKIQTKYIQKTLDGTSAGLQNLKSLRKEEEIHKKREAEIMKNMGKEISGYGQITVVRDLKKRRNRDPEKESAEKREKQKVEDEINKKYFKWGKGLKQMKEREDKLKRDLHEMSKPLARYANDEDLDRELRGRDRKDDPMLAYIKEKEIKEGKRAPEKPKYEGTYMPNRFGIKPGYRWDGVDRSNGYEKKWFEARNTKKAVEEEAYKWSTADM